MVRADPCSSTAKDRNFEPTSREPRAGGLNSAARPLRRATTPSGVVPAPRATERRVSFVSAWRPFSGRARPFLTYSLVREELYFSSMMLLLLQLCAKVALC